jgi:bisphosphoglycerate-dependent phosphoglycerate mutase
MSLDDLSPEEVLRLELATGIPVVYDMDEQCAVRSKRILEP